MNMIHRFLNHAFPLMAISGLLLVGWALIITPEEMKSDAQWSVVLGSSGASEAISMSP